MIYLSQEIWDDVNFRLVNFTANKLDNIEFDGKPIEILSLDLAFSCPIDRSSFLAYLLENQGKYLEITDSLGVLRRVIVTQISIENIGINNLSFSGIGEALTGIRSLSINFVLPEIEMEMRSSKLAQAVITIDIEINLDYVKVTQGIIKFDLEMSYENITIRKGTTGEMPWQHAKWGNIRTMGQKRRLISKHKFADEFFSERVANTGHTYI